MAVQTQNQKSKSGPARRNERLEATRCRCTAAARQATGRDRHSVSFWRTLTARKEKPSFIACRTSLLKLARMKETLAPCLMVALVLLKPFLCSQSFPVWVRLLTHFGFLFQEVEQLRPLHLSFAFNSHLLARGSRDRV